MHHPPARGGVPHWNRNNPFLLRNYRRLTTSAQDGAYGNSVVLVPMTSAWNRCHGRSRSSNALFVRANVLMFTPPLQCSSRSAP